MRDTAGQLYAGFGGILAGAGSGTLLAGWATGFTGWLLVVGIASCAATGLGLYMMVGSLAGWWLPGRRSSLTSVIENAQHLSAEIAVWIGDRSRQAHDYRPHRDTWERDTAQMLRHSNETGIHWNERFAVRALVAYDQLIAHGAQDAKDPLGPDLGRQLFEYPTNTPGMQQAGRVLGVMAAHLEAKKLSRSRGR